MLRLSLVLGCALLSIHANLCRAQSPIDFHRVTIPTVPAGNAGTVMSGQIFGSPEEEIIRWSQGGLAIVDIFSSATPSSHSYSVAASTTTVAIADLDANGSMDLAVVDGSAVRIARQAGTGSFSESYPLSSASNPIHAADMDNDGDVDLLVGGTLFLNGGTGTALQSTTFAIGAASSIDVAPGDVDGDGDLDKVSTFIGNSPSGPGLVSRIHRQNADHSFTLFSGQRLVANATSATTALTDMDGDGKSDVVFVAIDGPAALGGGSRTWIGQWLGTAASANGFTATTALESATTSGVPRTLAIADFDGDGRSDVVVPTSTFVNQADHAVISVYMTTSSGGLTPATGRALAAANAGNVADPLGVAVVNADQDGRPDLYVGESAGSISLFHNDAAVAQPVSMTILEAIGQDYVWTSGGNTLTFGLADAADGSVLYGTPLTLTVFLPAGGTLSATQAMGRRTQFVLPNPLSAQPVTVTLSSSGGWSKSFTVHPSASFTATTGGGQSAPFGSTFANPITTRFVNTQGQPLAGVAVEYPLNGVSTPTVPVVYTDVNGYATFTAGAGPLIGGQLQYLHAFDGTFSEPFALTTLGDVLQMATPLQFNSCLGQTITISGHLLNAVGAPRAGATVYFLQSSMSFPTQSTTTAADGSFLFAGTTPNIGVNGYTISSPSAPQNTITGQVTTSPVTITIDSGANQLACPNSPLQPITGHISSPCGDSLAGRPVYIVASGAPSLSFPVTGILTTAQGTFSFQPTFAVPPTGTVVAAIQIGCSTPPVTVTTTLTYSAGSLVANSGDLQITNAGSPFSQPLVVSSTGTCAFPSGTPVTFSTAALGVTFSPNTASIDGNGNASTTVSTSASTGGAVTIQATDGTTVATFHLFARRLLAISSTNLLLISYTHEHAGVPLVLAADSPLVPPLTTPWGTIRTSILAPGASFGVIDGMGIFGSIDPGMVTLATGAWNRAFSLPAPLGLTFVGQMYGYDLNAAFPFDYIVSNPVTFTF